VIAVVRIPPKIGCGGPPSHLVRGCLMDWKLELIAVPVTDVDRAKRFYTDQLG
jgi:hypothetical protein